MYRMPDRWPGLVRFVQPPMEGQQGLKFRIEVHYSWIGAGIRWCRKAQDDNEVHKLCQNAGVKALKSALNRAPQEDLCRKPTNEWLCYWSWDQEMPPGMAQIWTWYSEKNSSQAWFEEMAKRFWAFAEPIWQLVVQADQELRMLRA